MCVYTHTHTHTHTHMSFPGGSDGEASACVAGDPGSSPRLGRLPGYARACMLSRFSHVRPLVTPWTVA